MAAELNAKLATASIPVAGRGICYVSFKANPTLPTNATADMSTLTDFESLGELSDGGFSESRSISPTDHKGAHGTIIMTTIDSDTTKYKAAFLEVSRAAVAKLRFGDTVTLPRLTCSLTREHLTPSYLRRRSPTVISVAPLLNAALSPHLMRCHTRRATLWHTVWILP